MSAQLLNEKELAKSYGLTVAWLRRKRLARAGPPFLRLGRMVRYRRPDLESWLEVHDVEPRVQEMAQ